MCARWPRIMSISSQMRSRMSRTSHHSAKSFSSWWINFNCLHRRLRNGMCTINELALPKISFLTFLLSDSSTKMNSTILFELVYVLIPVNHWRFDWLFRTDIWYYHISKSWLFILNSRNHWMVNAAVIFIRIEFHLVKVFFFCSHCSITFKSILDY